MRGVTFSRSTAVRIGDAIRKIERLPGGQQELQRRRAGGLGRSTLWEVTAIQTGPGTVTIKRVSNIAFDLNDSSEKTGVLYDPNNEPAVEDRGLLIRLGNGKLFFFRRAPAINRLFFDEYCYIKSDDPTNSFGFPNTATVFYHWDITPTLINWYAIFKLVTPTPVASILPKNIFLRFGQLTSGIRFFNNFLQVAPSIFRLDGIYAIKQDFDASSLTWDSYSALSKQIITTGVLPVGRLTRVSGPTSAVQAECWPGVEGGIVFNNLSGMQNIFTTVTYGFGIHGQHEVNNTNELTMIFTRAPTGQRLDAFLEWFT